MEEKTIKPDCESNVIPVKRRSVRSNLIEDSVTCVHCSGLYKRNRFNVHLKNCKKYLSSQISEEKVDDPIPWQYHPQ
jgi:hypothetical protein